MNFEIARLYEDLDYLLNPVLAGMCSYESLKGDTLTLLDFGIMNDALMVQNENRARSSKAVQAAAANRS